MKSLKRKITLAISCFALVAMAASCASKKEEKKDVGALGKLPAWVLEPNVSDGIGAVGIASPSRGGIKFQIPKAELDAKGNIAATISSNISRVAKNALRESNVNEVNDVEEFFSQATKQVVNDLPLSGIKRINIHQGKDGTLYVHMVLKGDDYSKFLKNSSSSFMKKLRAAKMGRDNINASQKATQKIFDELERERGKY